MSVYTQVSPEELEAWLTRYAVGSPTELAPIAAGIENTNYFVTTTKGRYVLTLYERLPAEELPFYLNMMAHLAHAGVECPAPEPDRTGAFFSLLNGKPAASSPRRWHADRRAGCGALRCGRRPPRACTSPGDLPPSPTNRRGPGLVASGRACRWHLDAERNALLAAEIKFQTGYGSGHVAACGDPRRPVLRQRGSKGTRVSGITTSPAATDFPAYDLAITVNDWCILRDGDARGALVPELVEALVGAYQAVRPFESDERSQWSALLRAAALRFWLSRLYDLHLPRPGELVHAKDPAHFERILRERIARPSHLPDTLSAPPRAATIL
jgi:homoserine kinase type II